jgi:DNA-binding transcriptional ArsR family regulator
MISRRDSFQAIANPTRRAIISILAKEPINVNFLAENFNISRPAISQHLKLLIECELVSVTQKGRESFCHVHLEKLQEVNDWLEPLRKNYEARFKKLDDLLAK